MTSAWEAGGSFHRKGVRFKATKTVALAALSGTFVIGALALLTSMGVTNAGAIDLLHGLYAIDEASPSPAIYEPLGQTSTPWRVPKAVRPAGQGEAGYFRTALGLFRAADAVPRLRLPAAEDSSVADRLGALAHFYAGNLGPTWSSDVVHGSVEWRELDRFEGEVLAVLYGKTGGADEKLRGIRAAMTPAARTFAPELEAKMETLLCQRDQAGPVPASAYQDAIQRKHCVISAELSRWTLGAVPPLLRAGPVQDFVASQFFDRILDDEPSESIHYRSFGSLAGWHLDRLDLDREGVRESTVHGVRLHWSESGDSAAGHTTVRGGLVDNLVTNGGFAWDVPTGNGRPFGWGEERFIETSGVRVTTIPTTGTGYAAELLNPSAWNQSSLASMAFPVSPGAWYVISADVKGDGRTVPGVMLTSRKANGQWFSDQQLAGATAGLRSWERLTAVVHLPMKAAACQLWLTNVRAAGLAAFANVTVFELTDDLRPDGPATH